jgi:hypothetical protein
LDGPLRWPRGLVRLHFGWRIIISAREKFVATTYSALKQYSLRYGRPIDEKR